MLESKIIVQLAAIFLLAGCVSFKIDSDPVETERMVEEFIEEKNKSIFKKIRNIRMITKGYICRHSPKFMAYLCWIILNHDPYNENFDPDSRSTAGCQKNDINFRHSIRNPAVIRLYNCPFNIKKQLSSGNYDWNQYYLSRSHLKSSLFVYKSINRGRIYPDAVVSDLDMDAIRKDHKKRAKQIKKRLRSSSAHYMPASTRTINPDRSTRTINPDRMFLILRMPLVFSKSALNTAKSFEYLDIGNQNSPYTKFQMYFAKINVCQLRLQQQIYLCKQVLDNSFYNFEVEIIHYRKTDCRKRKILYEAWQFDASISTLMCPPAYTNYMGGAQKNYDNHSFFLSSGPEDQSVVLYERLHTATHITPKEVIYSVHRINLQKVLQIERSKLRTGPVSSDPNSGLPFRTPSPAPVTPEPSYFSSVSPGQRSFILRTSSMNGKSTQTTSLDRRQSLSFRRPSAKRRSAISQVQINIDRYVTEEAVIEFSTLQSIKEPYEHFRLAYAKDDMCSYPATLQTQLCKKILESSEFGYELEDRVAVNKTCRRKTISINLHDDEDLSSNSIALHRCPKIQAISLTYYISSSLQNKSAILFIKIKNNDFTSIYADAFITYTGGDILEHKADSTAIGAFKPRRLFNRNYLPVLV